MGLEKEKLWAKVIHTKYIKGTIDYTKFIPKTNYSKAWRGIVAERTRIYNGASTLFWRDKRIEEVPLLDIAIKEAGLTNSLKTVKQYWDPTRGWKREDLLGLIPDYLPF